MGRGGAGAGGRDQRKPSWRRGLTEALYPCQTSGRGSSAHGMFHWDLLPPWGRAVTYVRLTGPRGSARVPGVRCWRGLATGENEGSQGGQGPDRAEPWAGSQEDWTGGPAWVQGGRAPSVAVVSRAAPRVVLELDGGSPPCDLTSELCFFVCEDLGGRHLAECGDGRCRLPLPGCPHDEASPPSSAALGETS